MLDNTSDQEEIRSMENTGMSSKTYTLAEALSDPTARCVVTILVGNTRKVASYPTPYSAHVAVAEYLRTGWDLVSTTRDRVELSGGTSIVILVHRIPTDEEPTEVEQDDSIYYALMREHAARLDGKVTLEAWTGESEGEL
jgi:hypothetical protein